MAAEARAMTKENEQAVLDYINAKPNPNEYRILKKTLTKELWEKNKTKKTKLGGTLWDCLKSGVLMPDSKMGIYACDREAYDLFGSIFDPMIKSYFGINTDHPGKGYGDLKDKAVQQALDLKSVDRDNAILSTRVRVARNLDGYAYAAILSDADRKAVEQAIVKVTEKFDGDLKGGYKYLKDLDEKTQAQMVEDHILFHNKDEYIRLAGMFEDWPNGRGAFYNADQVKKAMIWVNEEDHMRVICLQKGNDLLEVYSRLIRLLTHIETNLKVAEHPKYGFLASCPTNVGTGLRASVHIKIPLASATPTFKDFCKDMNIDIRGVHGEHSESADGIFDISNKRRFGLSEYDALCEMTRGVKNLLRLEQNLKDAKAGK